MSTDPFTRALLTALDYEILPALEGESVFLAYGPRGKPKQTFEGTIKKEGIEVNGNLYSPSYAAVYCMQKAGSPRKTANGWIMWKTVDSNYLNDLYQQIGDEARESEEPEASVDVPTEDASL